MSHLPESHARTGGPTDSVRREMDLFDLIALLWSQKVFLIVVFMALFLPMAVTAYFVLKPTYEAQSRLLVLLDDQNLTPGAAGSGGAFELDQVLQSEIEILNSDGVRRRALEARGGEASESALKAMRSGFSVVRSPNASVLVARYEDADPRVAANVLNAIVAAYLDYRRELLVEDGAGGLVGRRVQAEIAAETAEADLRAFLAEHRLVDFDSERSAAIQRVNDLQARMLNARAEEATNRAGAAELAARLAEIPQNIEMYVENNVTGQLLDLEVRRRELLASYLPDSPPVVAIDRQIAALSEFVVSGGAEGAGQRRTGANPVYQEVDTNRLQFEGAAAAQARLAATLAAQLRSARDEVNRLNALAPMHDRLQRDVDARSEAASRLSTQTADAAARSGASPGAADSVRIVEQAVPPAEASSMRKIGVLAAGVLAGGIAAVLSLLKGYFEATRGPSSASGRVTQSRRSTAEDNDNAAVAAPGGARAARQAASDPPRSRPALPVLARVT